jgi:enamine deaminase RidA (YjgF/YER057c/UK114 family)
MRDTAFTFYGENLPIGTLLKQSEQWRGNVLGALCFDSRAPSYRAHSQMLTGLDIPWMSVPMPQLDTTESSCEVWFGSGSVSQGKYGDIHYRQDDGVLFGVVTLSEALFAASGDKTPLQQATESAYRQVFSLLDTLSFPYLFRFWNYMADINGHSFGLERYQQFNRGRQDAFLAHGRDVVGNVPAACALGFGQDNIAQGPLFIAFLAGRELPLSMENPRQISACLYPPQYGPRSPTFSRASLVRMGNDQVLFVSGTASIVGHETLHAGDVVAQAGETMANIEAVLAEVNRHSISHSFNLPSLSYKVYVRHAADLEPIRNELTRFVGGPIKAIYLQADVCRQDLLLEIEATAIHPSAFMSGQDI